MVSLAGGSVLACCVALRGVPGLTGGTRGVVWLRGACGGRRSDGEVWRGGGSWCVVLMNAWVCSEWT